MIPLILCLILISIFVLILIKISKYIPKLKNFIERLKDFDNNLQDIKSNDSLHYLSFNLSFFITSCIVFRLAFTVSIESNLHLGRYLISLILISYLLFIYFVIHIKLNILVACAFIYLFILCYLKLPQIFEPTITMDILAIIMGIFSTYHVIYHTFILFKKLYPVTRRIIKIIISSEATGLKRVLETITSIFLSVSALLAGIYGLIIAFESLIKYFLN